MPFTQKKASELGKKSSRKGVPNKSTSEIREAFRLLVADKLPKLSEWLDEVAKEDPEKALNIIAKYSEYILPKLQRTEISGGVTIDQLLSLTSEERRARIYELSRKIIKA